MARNNNDALHLRRVRDLYARVGCVPSYSEMSRALGFKAKNAAFKLVQRLVASGHLEKSVGGRLVPGPGFFTVDVGDDVRAGFGGEDNATDLLQAQALNQLLISKPSKTLLLKVRGDSMANAGILSGDVAVVEMSMQAVDGDVVVAEIDGSHSIKEYKADCGKPRPVANGQDRMSVSATGTQHIVGVVRGVVRIYTPPLAGRSRQAK